MYALAGLLFAPNTVILSVIVSPLCSATTLPSVSFAKNLPSKLCTLPIIASMIALLEEILYYSD